jgi:hypothetical protein
MAANMNNYKYFAGAQKLWSDIYPTGAPCNSPAAGTTDETLLLPPFPRIYVPDGLTEIKFWVSGITIVSSGDCDVKLYAGRRLYNGDEVFDSVWEDVAQAESEYVTVSSQYWMRFCTTIDISETAQMGMKWIYFVLTAENKDGSTQARIGSLDIQAGRP